MKLYKNPFWSAKCLKKEECEINSPHTTISWFWWPLSAVVSPRFDSRSDSRSKWMGNDWNVKRYSCVLRNKWDYEWRAVAIWKRTNLNANSTDTKQINGIEILISKFVDSCRLFERCYVCHQMVKITTTNTYVHIVSAILWEFIKKTSHVAQNVLAARHNNLVENKHVARQTRIVL